MSETEHVWRLDNEHTTVMLANPGGDHHNQVPALIWFGHSLPPTIDTTSLLCSMSTANPPAKLDQRVGVSLLPTIATGYLGAPALQGHRNGKHFSPCFTLERVSGAKDQLAVILSDLTASLNVSITLTLDPQSSILTISTQLTNRGERYGLDWLASATVPLRDQQSECLSLHGRWGGEFQRSRRHIDKTRIQIENLSGRTSHEQFPGIVCGTEGFGEQHGQVLGTQLAWSGNYRSIVEQLSDGESYMQIGAVALPGEIQLGTDASWTAPSAHFCAASGLNLMSQRFHEFTRQHVLPAWTRTARPVHANSWEALYFDHSTSTLIELIDAAADLGAERFVLDDGWFLGRRSDNAGLGDWYVDESIYPDGLQPVVNHVRSRGMQFGLWFEPEMVNPDSKLYREHPDWALHVDGYTTPLARHQLALNLQLPDVQDYLYKCIAALVQAYAIDYIKWDMNRDLVFAGDGEHAAALAQPQACYKLLARLNTQFPALEIESCSSGGARSDLGILAHTGRVWTSDNIDPIDRLNIHRGFSLFFPPEIMAAHVGHATAHLTGRATNLHTRAIVALQGQFGYELDARTLDRAESDMLTAYTDLYKQHRDWISESCYWRVPTRNTALFVSGMVATDKSQSLWTIVTAISLQESVPERLVLIGLNPDSHYVVNLASLNLDQLRQYAKALPAWIESGVTLPGVLLMSTGLTLPVLPAQCGLLLTCTEQSI